MFYGKVRWDVLFIEIDILFFLVLVFYGYFGNCFLLLYLVENIVFKGYVVVFIDYIDFIYRI